MIAVGAALPATCYGAIPPDERARLAGAALDAHPAAHRDCVELDVTVADDLGPEECLAEVERTYSAQLGALAGLVQEIQPAR